MRDTGDSLSIFIDIDDDNDNDNDDRIHTWLSHQCSLTLSPHPPMSPSLTASLQDSSLPAMRADSPLLGFPSPEPLSNSDASKRDPLHFPSPTYSRDLPDQHRVRPTEAGTSLDKPLPVLPSGASRNSNVVPLPPSFTRLPFHPRRHQRTSSSSRTHSRNTSSSTSHVSLSRFPSVVATYAACPPITTPNLSRRPSTSNAAAPQPPLPKMSDIQYSPPISPKLFPVTLPFARSRSQSAASLGSPAYVSLPPPLPLQPSPLPPQSTPTRRQSVYPRLPSISSAASGSPPPVPFSLSSSSLCLVPSASDTGSPDHSVRNAVYIDSEEVSQKLSELLRTTASEDGDVSPSEDEDATEEGLFFTPSATSPRTSPKAASGSPQASNAHIPTRYPTQTPHASASQIYLGPSTVPLPTRIDTSGSSASLHPLIVSHSASSSEDELEAESPMFHRSHEYGGDGNETPGTSPANSANGSLTLVPPLSQSRWSLGSSMVDLGKISQAKDTKEMKPKQGRRQRLVSFISRFSVAPQTPPLPAVDGHWTPSAEEALAKDADDTVPPLPSSPFSTQRPPVLPHLKINTSFAPLRATHTPNTSTSTSASAASGLSSSSLASIPTTLDSASTSKTSLSVGRNEYRGLPPSLSPHVWALDSDPFASHMQAPATVRASAALTISPSTPTLHHYLDCQQTMSPTTIVTPVARPPSPHSPTSPTSTISSGDPVRRSTSWKAGRSMTDLGRKNEMKRRSLHRGGGVGFGLKNFIGRVWDRDVAGGSRVREEERVMEEEGECEEVGKEWTGQGRVGVRMGMARMSGVRLGMGRYRAGSTGSGGSNSGTLGAGGKRKLVISGGSEDNVKGFEAVRAWCEAFGEVRQIQRKANGVLYVDFRKTSVADTVCRVQAQVYIKGAGSVSLSWCSSSKK